MYDVWYQDEVNLPIVQKWFFTGSLPLYNTFNTGRGRAMMFLRKMPFGIIRCPFFFPTNLAVEVSATYGIVVPYKLFYWSYVPWSFTCTTFQAYRSMAIFNTFLSNYFQFLQGPWVNPSSLQVFLFVLPPDTGNLFSESTEFPAESSQQNLICYSSPVGSPVNSSVGLW